MKLGDMVEDYFNARRKLERAREHEAWGTDRQGVARAAKGHAERELAVAKERLDQFREAV